MTRTQSTVMSSRSGAVGLISSLTKIQTNDEDAAAPGTTGRHLICRSQRYKPITRMQASAMSNSRPPSSLGSDTVSIPLSLTSIQSNDKDASNVKHSRSGAVGLTFANRDTN